MQEALRHLLEDESVSWAFFVRPALSFQQALHHVWLHVGLLNEWVIVKRPFPLLQWCWWWISPEEACCQYVCFDLGLALALATHEDGGCRGKSVSHRRRGEFVSGSTVSSVLIGTQPLVSFYSGGDLPPRWTFIPLGWHASRTNSQLECNADPSVDIFPLRWVKLYIKMLLVQGFLAIISWLNVEWRGLRKTPQEMKEKFEAGTSEPGNLKRWLLYSSLSISSLLMNEWMSE